MLPRAAMPESLEVTVISINYCLLTPLPSICRVDSQTEWATSRQPLWPFKMTTVFGLGGPVRLYGRGPHSERLNPARLVGIMSNPAHLCQHVTVAQTELGSGSPMPGLLEVQENRRFRRTTVLGPGFTGAGGCGNATLDYALRVETPTSSTCFP